MTSAVAPPLSSTPSADRHFPAVSTDASASRRRDGASNDRSSPGRKSAASSSNLPPPVRVKKEPASPMPSRPRPKRLDLSTSASASRAPHTARPAATGRDSAGLAIHDVGLACLSPGFQTHDPAMREQLQRSLDVRDQQRLIIEARQKGSRPATSNDEASGQTATTGQRSQDTTLFGMPTRTPTTARRKGPPPGLSIAAPSAAQFASDRVIQSAPLHQTFTGLRPEDPQYSRHAQHGPSGLSQLTHIHHVPAVQTNNRLPPIADVFAHDRLDVRAPSSTQLPTTRSPGGFAVPSHPGPPSTSRGREFRSADEAMAGLSGGRDDLMPKVVHYGGAQPSSPRSPRPSLHHHSHTSAGAPQSHSHPHAEPSSRPSHHMSTTSHSGGRRRGRDEYERDNGSPPHRFNTQQHEPKRPTTTAVRGDDAASGDNWRHGLGGAEKRAEFLRLCERAWDLFHS